MTEEIEQAIEDLGDTCGYSRKVEVADKNGFFKDIGFAPYTYEVYYYEGEGWTGAHFTMNVSGRNLYLCEREIRSYLPVFKEFLEHCDKAEKVVEQWKVPKNVPNEASTPCQTAQ